MPKKPRPTFAELDVVGGDVELPAEEVHRRRASPANAPQTAMTQDVVARDADAAVARGLGVEADRAHLVAGGRAVEQHPEDERRAASAMKIPMCRPCSSGSPQKTGQLGARHDVAGHRHRLLRRVGVLQRAVELEQVDADPDRDPVEHDRRDHLVGADRRLQQPGDPRPDRAGQRGERRSRARCAAASACRRTTSRPRPRR